MSSVSSTELPYWENKEFDAWFSPADLEHSHPTSFFDLGFDYNEDVLESSDISAEYNFFDEIDLVSTSTEASVFSTTIDGASNGDIHTTHKSSPRPAQIVPEAPVPTSQRLVHRLRPEGVAISSADLLSIEGRRQNSLTALFRPKTPPPTPQHRFGWNTPKTPRTPKERDSKVQKGTGSMRSPKKAMQPSNYYDPDTPSMPDWSDRFQRFSLQQNSLPITPPVSTRIGYNTQPGRINTSHHVNQLAGSPTPTRESTVRRMSSSSPMPMDQPIRQSIEHDSNQISPLAPWTEDSNPLSFSPVSPLLPEDQWATNALAHLGNSQFDAYPSSGNLPDTSGLPLAATGGLLIDFGDSSNPNALGHGLNVNDVFSEQYSLEDQNSMAIAPRLNLHAPNQHQHPSRSDSLDSAGSYAHSFTSRSPTPSPKTSSHPYPYPNPASQSYSTQSYSSQSMRSKTTRRAPAHRKGTSKDISLDHADRAGTMPSHKRNNSSKSGTIGKGGVGKRGQAPGGLGGMFVNFTPSDSRRILGGVAPSGSSKTKARREKEARDERRKMSEAAKRAVQEAGGNWECLAGELVEV